MKLFPLICAPQLMAEYVWIIVDLLSVYPVQPRYMHIYTYMWYQLPLCRLYISMKIVNCVYAVTAMIWFSPPLLATNSLGPELFYHFLIMTLILNYKLDGPKSYMASIVKELGCLGMWITVMYIVEATFLKSWLLSCWACDISANCILEIFEVFVYSNG